VLRSRNTRRFRRVRVGRGRKRWLWCRRRDY